MFKRGFLLLEVLCLVGMLSCVLMIAVPLYQQLPVQIIHAELDQLELLCWYLRQMAMAGAQQVVLHIDPAVGQYRYRCNGVWTTVWCGQRITLASPSGALGPPSDPQHKIVQPATFPLRGQCYEVSFLPSGVISAGTLYISVFGSGVGGALTCAVSQVSYIRKYIFDRGRWCIVSSGS